MCNIKWVFKWLIMENASHWKHLFRSIARYFGYWIETFMLVSYVNCYITFPFWYESHRFHNWNVNLQIILKLYFCASNAIKGAWCNFVFSFIITNLIDALKKKLFVRPLVGMVLGISTILGTPTTTTTPGVNIEPKMLGWIGLMLIVNVIMVYDVTKIETMNAFLSFPFLFLETFFWSDLWDWGLVNLGG